MSAHRGPPRRRGVDERVFFAAFVLAVSSYSVTVTEGGTGPETASAAAADQSYRTWSTFSSPPSRDTFYQTLPSWVVHHGPVDGIRPENGTAVPEKDILQQHPASSVTTTTTMTDDHRTVPSPPTSDYRTILSWADDFGSSAAIGAADYQTAPVADLLSPPPSVTGTGVRDSTAEASDEWLLLGGRRPAAGLLPPPPSVTGSKLHEVTTETSNERLPGGRPYSTPVRNRYRYRRPSLSNRYRPPQPPEIKKNKCHGQSDTKFGRPGGHTASENSGAWTSDVTSAMDTGWAMLRSVQPKYVLMLAVGKLAIVIAVKLFVLAKTFVLTKLLNLLVLPIMPFFWPWFASTLKPTSVVAVGPRTGVECRKPSGPASCDRNWSSGGPDSSYGASGVDSAADQVPANDVDPSSNSTPSPPKDPDLPAGSSILPVTGAPDFDMSLSGHTTGFPQRYRKRISIRSARQPLFTGWP